MNLIMDLIMINLVINLIWLKQFFNSNNNDDNNNNNKGLMYGQNRDIH